MALGAGILSNNLNGKTANVTFLPLSGGTFDLGVKTIPFNNITDYPYGEYIIHVIELDYTYTLTVSEPLGMNQSYAKMGNILGETNFSIASLNFNDFTAEIIDLGIDSTYWGANNWYMLTESGYMIVFSNNGDNNRLVVFTDLNSNIIEQYSATTTSYDYDTLDGKICYFSDNTNGVVKYFNGSNVYEYTFNPSYEQFGIEWDWDGVCIDNTFVFIITNTETNAKYSYRALNNGSVLPIDSWDSTIEYRYYGTYYPSVYFYELAFLVSDSSLSFIRIYDSLGNVYGFPEIAANTYTSYSRYWYGSQSFGIVLWSSSDVDVPYYFLDFDGSTQNIVSTTHTRGANYQNLNSYSDTNFYPNDNNTGSVFHLVYGSTSGYEPGGGYGVDYLDIVYKLENSTDFSTYLYTDTGDYTKYFETNIYTGGYKQFYTMCSTGDSVSSVLFINSEGTKISQTSEIITDLDQVDYGLFGNRFVVIQYKNEYGTVRMNLFDNGDLFDTTTFNVNGNFSWNQNYETFYARTFDTAFYVNNTVTGFTSTDVYTSSYESYSYYVQDYYKRNGNIILFNENTSYARVLMKDSLSDEFFLPQFTNNYELRPGRSSFLYVFEDEIGATRMNLYSFDGALLTSVSGVTGWNDVYAGKDRYVIVQNIDGQVFLTMMNESGYNQITIDDEVISWWQINDYILWD